MVAVESIPASPGLTSWAQRLHREVFQVSTLIALTVAGFFATRAAAGHVRAEAVKDAATWYTRGVDARAGGRTIEAADDFRHAVQLERANSPYALALAQALAADHRDLEAERILQPLRERYPEDPAINLELARLAARRQDERDAIRYYRSALEAPWTDPGGPQHVRLELIRFLIDRHESDRAIAELMIARTAVTPTTEAHTELGSLFAEVSAWKEARQEFERALAIASTNESALQGAARAAYETGDYAAAVAWLSRTQHLPADLARARDVARLVLAHDPLARHLGRAARRQRLVGDIEYVNDRIRTCPAAEPPIVPPRSSTVFDQDAIEDALAVLGDAERRLEAACTLTPLDSALLRIAARHPPSPS
jgi:tetratricopeptide (TPR) repeat protein